MNSPAFISGTAQWFREKNLELRHALWLNVLVFCRLNRDKPKILALIFESTIESFERVQDVHHKHLIMCQMLAASQFLARESAVDTLLKLFLNYSREDNIEFDPDFVRGAFLFLQKIGFANIKESAMPFFRSILIKPSQHLKIIFCEGLRDLGLQDFHLELLNYLLELSKDDQQCVQKKVPSPGTRLYWSALRAQRRGALGARAAQSRLRIGDGTTAKETRAEHLRQPSFPWTAPGRVVGRRARGLLPAQPGDRVALRLPV